MVYDWFNRQSETAPTQPPADSDATSQEPQQETAANADDDPLEWARQAYARLKAQKEQANAIVAEPVPESNPAADSESQPESAAEPEPAEAEPAPVAGLSLLEQAAAQRQERQQQLEQEPEVAAQPIAEAEATDNADRDEEPSLGEFDDTFTWSAEVLAAQGR